MEYRLLGSTGVKVTNLCLGTMNFGGPSDEAASERILREYVDAGGNFIDTANMYNQGESERVTGKALQGIRHKVVLATKVNRPMGEGPNERGNSRRHILYQVYKSLERLGTDYIDLYWIHRPDPGTPVEETLRTLDKLVRDGVVRYAGCSTFPAWQIMESLWVSDRRNLISFIAEQPPYNIFERRVEKRVLPLCGKYGMALVTWSPLAGGWLADKFQDKGGPGPETRISRFPDMEYYSTESAAAQRRFDVLEELRPMAEGAGVSMAAFAAAWLLQRPGVTAPIIGPRTVEHLRDYLKSLKVKIPAEHLKRIDELVPPGTSIWFGDEDVDVI